MRKREADREGMSGDESWRKGRRRKGRETGFRGREKEESCSLIELFTRVQRHLESRQPLLSVLIA